MRLYLAGPMRGYPEFNFPAFRQHSAELRAMGHEVFSPAEKDEEEYGSAVSASATGDLDEAKLATGFDLRKALFLDMEFICKKADGIALLRGWEGSAGACAESATAKALGLKRYIQTDDGWREIDRNGHLMSGKLAVVN